MSTTTELADVLIAATRGALSRVRTGIPAKVTAYDPLTNTVDVEIVVDNPVFDLDDGRTFETFPPIPSVPVIWPRAGGYVVTLPLGPGDFVWLAFSELPLAEWRSTGQKSQPVDARRHSIGYPYATPGAFPDTSPLSPSPLDVVARSSMMVMGEDGGPAQIVIDKAAVPTIKIGREAVDFVALSIPTQAGIAAAMAQANAASAAALAMISTFNTHTHTGVTSGAGVTGAPSAPAAAGPPAAPVPGPVAAVMTKAL